MQIKGTVKNTVFYNAENGYTVATLNVNGEDITVVGCSLDIPENANIPGGAMVNLEWLAEKK